MTAESHLLWAQVVALTVITLAAMACCEACYPVNVDRLLKRCAPCLCAEATK